MFELYTMRGEPITRSSMAPVENFKRFLSNLKQVCSELSQQILSLKLRSIVECSHDDSPFAIRGEVLMLSTIVQSWTYYGDGPAVDSVVWQPGLISFLKTLLSSLTSTISLLSYPPVSIAHTWCFSVRNALYDVVTRRNMFFFICPGGVELLFSKLP